MVPTARGRGEDGIHAEIAKGEKEASAERHRMAANATTTVDVRKAREKGGGGQRGAEGRGEGGESRSARQIGVWVWPSSS